MKTTIRPRRRHASDIRYLAAYTGTHADTLFHHDAFRVAWGGEETAAPRRTCVSSCPKRSPIHGTTATTSQHYSRTTTCICKKEHREATARHTHLAACGSRPLMPRACHVAHVTASRTGAGGSARPGQATSGPPDPTGWHLGPCATKGHSLRGYVDKEYEGANMDPRRVRSFFHAPGSRITTFVYDETVRVRERDKEGHTAIPEFPSPA